MREFLLAVIFLALTAVAATLGMGVYSLLRGGDYARTWSNKLMRLRVLLQFVAIIIILVSVLLMRHA